MKKYDKEPKIVRKPVDVEDLEYIIDQEEQKLGGTLVEIRYTTPIALEYLKEMTHGGDPIEKLNVYLGVPLIKDNRIPSDSIHLIMSNEDIIQFNISE